MLAAQLAPAATTPHSARRSVLALAILQKDQTGSRPKNKKGIGPKAKIRKKIGFASKSPVASASLLYSLLIRSIALERRCQLLRLRLRFSHMSVKDQVLQLIHRLPDDIDYRDISEEIAFLAAIEEAERDIEQGRLVSNEQMRSRIAAWTIS